MVVDDNQIVVLGGLIEDRMSDGNDKVPVLGDVPGVGTLFRYDARRREKTNLMVFLKPTVLRSTQDGRELTSERYDYLNGEQQRIDARRASVLARPDEARAARGRHACPGRPARRRPARSCLRIR